MQIHLVLTSLLACRLVSSDFTPERRDLVSDPDEFSGNAPDNVPEGYYEAAEYAPDDAEEACFDPSDYPDDANGAYYQPDDFDSDIYARDYDDPDGYEPHDADEGFYDVDDYDLDDDDGAYYEADDDSTLERRGVSSQPENPKHSNKAHQDHAPHKSKHHHAPTIPKSKSAGAGSWHEPLAYKPIGVGPYKPIKLGPHWRQIESDAPAVNTPINPGQSIPPWPPVKPNAPKHKPTDGPASPWLHPRPKHSYNPNDDGPPYHPPRLHYTMPILP